MHYIYHIPGKKIGCTTEYPQRCIEQNFDNYELLETHEDGWIAGDREQELQKQYGYPVDKTHYMVILQNRQKGQSLGGVVAGNKNAQVPGKMKTLAALGGAIGGKINMAKEHTCPHCNVTMKGPNAFRYHFDNCKTLKSI